MHRIGYCICTIQICSKVHFCLMLSICVRTNELGPVVQSTISLTSSFLTVQVSTISNSPVFLLKKMGVAFKSYSHSFSKNISIYAIFNDQSFNDTITNDIVSFEQQGP